MNHNEKIIEFFKEISKIPRASGDEKAISDYLVKFAKDRNLEVYQDEHYNVIIKKKASSDCIKTSPVILQGHMDMVYVKRNDSNHNYKDGINVLEKDGLLYADGTSLGADNGVAVAYILTLLDSDDIKHPDIEAIITVKEEVGLEGAQSIDATKISGKYLINLDAENEGVFFTSCAGGVRCHLGIPFETEEKSSLNIINISIQGLKGGHSGLDIAQGRANAIKLGARILNKIQDEYSLVDFTCNGAANAIANECFIKIAVSPEKCEAVKNEILDFAEILKKEYRITDSEINIGAEINSETEKIDVLTENSKNNLVCALILHPQGIQGMSFDMPGLVESSINIGAVTRTENKYIILSSTRSSVASKKKEIKDFISVIASVVGGSTYFFNDYPQWTYNPTSPLRDIAVEAYESLFNKKAQTTAVHAGLECGYFDDKIEGLDIISFGADLSEPHSPNETARVQSIYNIWKLIVEILEKLSA